MMPRQTVKEQKHLFSTYWPALVLALLAFGVAYQFVVPPPPNHLTIAAGSPEGAYYQFALSYKKILAREKVRLDIIETAGSIENLGLLERHDAQIGFVQGGTGSGRTTDELRSLGGIEYEPMWVFYRGNQPLRQLTDVAGKRVAVGTDGSGTKALTLFLLRDNGVDEQAIETVSLGGRQALEALVKGEVEIAVFVVSPTAPLVRTLLEQPGIHLMNFHRVDAYARRHNFLSSVNLPEGAMDLQKNIPAESVSLLAPVANLVMNDSLHPALADLLLQAMDEVHGNGGWFGARGDFPTSEFLEFPLSDEAGRFYKHGAPFLQRYLPFWAATLVDRLKIMLLPLVMVLLPLFKLMPPVYNWRMRARIYRWYSQLEVLDGMSRKSLTAEQKEILLKALFDLREEVMKIDVPLSFSGQLYDLRIHIKLVRGSVMGTDDS
ncbi:C4-dicarboxylate ABC transporter substrate-binding protein [bacterium endosymbiont of Escarpia laminata]|nr:MAG: C4-dicarboxylate ABC transporter substrate-binding protein [bacterium endosymbiont of Escarpia laminata]